MLNRLLQWRNPDGAHQLKTSKNPRVWHGMWLCQGHMLLPFPHGMSTPTHVHMVYPCRVIGSSRAPPEMEAILNTKGEGSKNMVVLIVEGIPR